MNSSLTAENGNDQSTVSGFFLKEKRSRLLCLGLIAALVLINYAGTLRGGFVYDDHYLIVNNLSIRSISNIPLFFSNPFLTSDADPSRTQYRPVRSCLWALLYAIWGLNPAPYHAANVVFHAFNSILVFLFFSKIFSRSWPALVGALIFATHPAMTEVVCWACCMDNILCSFFYLLGLLWYLRASDRNESKRVYLNAASIIAMTLALLSKEMAITFPLAIVAIDIWRCGFKGLSGKKLAAYAPFFIVAIAYVVLRTHLLGKVAQVNPQWSATPAVITALIGREFLYYCRLLLFPFHLTVFPVVSTKPFFHDITAVSGLVIVILLLSGSIIFRRKSPHASLGIILFLIFLLPVSNNSFTAAV